MCCISSSFSVDSLLNMVNQGKSRAGHSWSVTVIRSGRVILLNRGLVVNTPDELDEVILHNIKPNLIDRDYIIVHQQAPTTSERTAAVHPATSPSHPGMLWHNGIIKQSSVDQLQATYNRTDKWDTMLLSFVLNDFIENDVDHLSSIRGGFACVYVNSATGDVNLLRNSVCPLFVNSVGDVSSIQSGSMQPLPVNTVFHLDLNTKQLIPKKSFESAERPYLFL